MSKSIAKSKKTFKNLALTALSIGAVALLFQGASQVVLASEFQKSEIVNTSYHKNTAYTAEVNEEDLKVPDGYVKPQYTVIDNDLDYYKDKKPTSLDITRDEAAEIGVRKLFEIFGIDLNNKTIEMGYNPSQRGYRSQWSGEWWVDGPQNSTKAAYSFAIDSLTGEVLYVINTRELKTKANTGFDSALNKDSSEYSKLAVEIAQKLNLVNGAVKTTEYGGQGFTNNDPTIIFDIVGENGERASLNFSRHDKALLSVTFEEGVKEMDVAEKNAQEVAERAEEFFEKNPNATSYEEF